MISVIYVFLSYPSGALFLLYSIKQDSIQYPKYNFLAFKALAMDKLELAAKVLGVPVSLLVTPLHYDKDVKKTSLLADLVKLFDLTQETPVVDIIHTIVKSELNKLK